MRPLGTFQAATLRLLHVPALRKTPTALPHPVPHPVWFTVTSTSQVDQIQWLLPGNYSIASETFHTFHIPCPQLWNTFPLLPSSSLQTMATDHQILGATLVSGI